MYKILVRPILFLFSPEFVHHVVVVFIKLGFLIPGIKKVTELLFSHKHSSLKREFCGIEFKNPVGLAAGFDKNAEFFNEISVFGFSFVEIGTVTPEPQPGNEKPRLFRIKEDKALINRMGFNNLGIEKVVERLKKRKKELIIGVNIGKNTKTSNDDAINDYLLCFNKAYPYADYIVINVSCPNIGNLTELQDKEQLKKILVRILEERSLKGIRKPVLLKISPDLNHGQLDDIIELYYKTGIDGIIATNTTIGRNNLSIRPEKMEEIGDGGLSGAPLKKRSTEIIKYIHQKSNGKIPVIGVGGILTPEDAMEKLEAGASLVQLYTGFIYEGPTIVKKINRLLSDGNA